MSVEQDELVRGPEYVIPAENLAVLRAQLAQLNKRTLRLGTPEISLHCLGEESRTDDHGFTRVYTRIQVTGARPRITGYLLVGWCEYFAATPEGQETAEQIILVFSVPGVATAGDLAGYDEKEPGCDHCHQPRWRKKTYILRHIESKKTLQIGTDCLQNYTGYDDPHVLAEMAQLLFDADQCCQDACADDDLWELGSSGKQAVLDLRYYLSWVAFFARKEGFVSSKVADERRFYGESVMATWELAFDAIARLWKYRGLEMGGERPAREHFALAEAAIAWIRSEETEAWISQLIQKEDPWSENTFSYYLERLQRLCKMCALPERYCKVVAGVIQQYLLVQERAMEREREALISQYQGKPGGKPQLWTLLVERISPYKRKRTYSREDTGRGFFVKLSDSAGNVFGWFASALPAGFIEGHRYQLRATVREHRRHDGVETTYLWHCKDIVDLNAVHAPESVPDLGLCACGEPLADLYRFYGGESRYLAGHFHECLHCGSHTRHIGARVDFCPVCGFGHREDEAGTLFVYHHGQWEPDPEMPSLGQRLARGY
jgi:hypothetical protein